MVDSGKRWRRWLDRASDIQAILNLPAMVFHLAVGGLCVIVAILAAATFVTHYLWFILPGFLVLTCLAILVNGRRPLRVVPTKAEPEAQPRPPLNMDKFFEQRELTKPLPPIPESHAQELRTVAGQILRLIERGEVVSYEKVVLRESFRSHFPAIADLSDRWDEAVRDRKTCHALLTMRMIQQLSEDGMYQSPYFGENMVTLIRYFHVARVTSGQGDLGINFKWTKVGDALTLGGLSPSGNQDLIATTVPGIDLGECMAKVQDFVLMVATWPELDEVRRTYEVLADLKDPLLSELAVTEALAVIPKRCMLCRGDAVDVPSSP